MTKQARQGDGIADRLMRYVSPEPNTGCWLWAGAVTHNGYGRFKRGGKTRLAHRESYEVFVRPIPAGLTIDHLCRNTYCVNPTHLEPVTPRVNVLRGETITARNADKTHCVRGHPLAGENLLIRRNGRRRCWTCHRATQKQTMAKAEQKAKHAARERLYRARRKGMGVMLIRQGDVLLEKVKGAPAGATPEETQGGAAVLAYGESTGHAHSVPGVDAAILAKGAERFLRANRATQLRHQEHGPIRIARGTYSVTIQREFDPITMARTVVD